MKKSSIILVLVFALLVAFVSIAITQAQKGWEKTLTLPSGEVVLDMSGEWDDYHEFLEQLKWMGKPSSNIVLITQEGNTFSGVSQRDTIWFPKGTEKCKGILDKDGFKEVQVCVPMYEKLIWVPVTWEISEHGNKIVFVDTDRNRWTFTRR